jgi:protein-tyrosine phosphatase
MIDLHLHLLPGVDDGAASLDVSKGMIALARDVGFATLVATPHLDGPLSGEYRARVAAAWSQVAPIAAVEGVQVALGYEIKLAPDLVHRLESGEPVTLGGGKSVLVELPFVGWPNYTEHALFELLAAGYRPLLAHPERYVEAHRDVDRLIRLADGGVSLQVTFGSLCGLFGRRAREVAEELLRRDVATVLATDAHSAGQRFESVRQGGDRAAAIVGTARYRQLVHDNPEALLHDRPLPTPAPATARDGADRNWRLAIRRIVRKVGI